MSVPADRTAVVEQLREILCSDTAVRDVANSGVLRNRLITAVDAWEREPEWERRLAEVESERDHYKIESKGWFQRVEKVESERDHYRADLLQFQEWYAEKKSELAVVRSERHARVADKLALQAQVKRLRAVLEELTEQSKPYRVFTDSGKRIGRAIEEARRVLAETAAKEEE